MSSRARVVRQDASESYPEFASLKLNGALGALFMVLHRRWVFSRDGIQPLRAAGRRTQDLCTGAAMRVLEALG